MQMANPVDTEYSTDAPKRLNHRQRPARFCNQYFILWLAVLLLSVIGSGVTHAASCVTSSGAAAVTACEKELASNPKKIDLRIRYADALMDQRRYEEAVNVLRNGLTMHPGNTSLKKKYRLASSLAEEQKSIGRIVANRPAPGTSRGLSIILCKTLKGERALQACNDVLKTDPENVTALTRRGDELMTLNQVKGAASSYRQAVKLDPANALLKRKLKTAEAKIPAEDRVDVATSETRVKAPSPERKIEGSKPKIYVPPVKPPQEQRKADISTVAIAETAPIEKLPVETTPETAVARTDESALIQHYSNAPLSSGVTF